MQYSSIILAALAASGAVAAPQGRRSVDTSIRVILQNQATEAGTQNIFSQDQRQEKTPSQSGPFETVELVGKDVKNQEFRCQIQDSAGKPIVIVRGANTDITFSDADKGQWKLRTPTKVSKVVCDPTFQKGATDAAEIRVVLSNQATETGSQTVLLDGKRSEAGPVGSSGPFQTVELRLGNLVANQAERCQILDKDGKPIIVLRGANRDITFSDADKGEWTLEKASEVSKIICDQSFVAKKV